MEPNNDLIRIYAECSNGYHKVDDFRAKLLGLLPFASGIGIFGSLYGESGFSKYHVAIGIFGTLVTFGLLIYELKGITKCTQFIFLGKWIECQMIENLPKVKLEHKENSDDLRRGYFAELAQERKSGWIVAEPVASAFIYSTVMAAWWYVILEDCAHLKYWAPGVGFLLCFIWIYVYWQNVFKKCKTCLKTSREREAKRGDSQ